MTKHICKDIWSNYSLSAKNLDSNGRWGGSAQSSLFFFINLKSSWPEILIYEQILIKVKKKKFKNMNINNINTDKKPSSASLLLQHWAESLQKLTNSKQ